MLASFGQGSNAIKSAEQGTGLGLPIAKNLVDLHGGTFTLKSKLREGTEVIVTFPPERVMSALAPVVGAVARRSSRPRPPSPRRRSAARARIARCSRSAHDRLQLSRSGDEREFVRGGPFPFARRAYFPGRPPKAMPIQTPCNKICTIDPGSGLCRGCGRSLSEIAQWSALTD